MHTLHVAPQVSAYSLPFELPVTLRPYQRDGINWLAFLRRFGLHGVLADDMGLGKTLQVCAPGAGHAGRVLGFRLCQVTVGLCASGQTKSKRCVGLDAMLKDGYNGAHGER